MRAGYSADKVRLAERKLMSLVPDGALMQRAAAGLASVCTRLMPRSYGLRVLVLAGSGDNGGDALFACALLARRGAAVSAIPTGSRMHEAGARALVAAGGRVLTLADAAAELSRAELVIDGILGIGGRGGLREPAAGLVGPVARAAESGALVVATDLPSGVDADTGVVAGPAIRAAVTVTFGAIKPGLLIDPGASMAGAVELIDIGLDPHLPDPPDVLALQAADLAALLPRPAAESDKYRRGVLGLLAGSDQYTGAAALATGGAVRGGAGMVRLVTTRRAADVVRQLWPEAVISVHPEPEPGLSAAHPAASAASGHGTPAATGRAVIEGAGRVQAWVAGPGIGTGDRSAELLEGVLATNLPVLVDADGLTVAAARPGLLARPAPTLLTPHAGELARLLGADRADIEAARLEHVRRAAAELGVTVLLKGSTTVVASPDPDEPVMVNPTGTGWLATAGSGDVLSGLGGALLAQGLPPVQAAAAAAFLHGLAGRLAARDAPLGAGDLLTTLPDAFRMVAGAVS